MSNGENATKDTKIASACEGELERNDGTEVLRELHEYKQCKRDELDLGICWKRCGKLTSTSVMGNRTSVLDSPSVSKGELLERE